MIGKTLVHYEISAQIGRGGMGEVYQAKDTKLGRDVAIKVLPEEFATDADRVARFQREAKLLASLNHPNIAAIHGLEESDGTHFLVMELIEGETLRDRIKTGPIPVEEALKLALQMAEALEAAHEKGVIHRDLKPANIKVTPEGKVKVLDFGLAKAYAGDQENVSPLDSPTISAAATQKGVILGTAAYMSPEQARGKPVDRRADIWAFGAVLYEMLTGQTAFRGEDVSETLSSVIKGDSNLTLLPANIHPRIREVITRCLQKEMRKRYSSIGDAQYEIEQVIADPSGIFVQPVTAIKPRKKIRVGITWVLAAIALALVIGGIAIWFLKPAPPPEPKRVMRFTYELPEDQQFPADIELAVSTDGSQFVYPTTDGLFLRSVDALDARRITGTDRNSRYSVFSPDGRWIAYWSSNEQKLMKIAISGGIPVVLCDTSIAVTGLSWSSDNTILFSDVMGGGVKRVSANGGTPELLFKAELANLATDGIPFVPQMLPDGKTILFGNLFSMGDYSKSQMTVHSLETGERKVLVAGIAGGYLSSGHLVYMQVNENMANLVSVPFNPDTLEVMGGPVSLVENISNLGLSNSGTLVYIPGTGGDGSAPLRTLVWVDREGKEEQIDAEPNIYSFPRISPNGNQVALCIEDLDNRNPEIFVWDDVHKILNKRTFDKSIGKAVPIWTPDGERIVYYSNHEDLSIGGIYWRPANGTGEAEKLVSNPDRMLFPYSFSNDGKILAMYELSAASNLDISILSMEDDGERKQLLQTEFIEGQPKISPDNQYIAYICNESGQMEIYVSPLLDVKKGKWQISQGGGTGPLWSPDGKELFYLSLDNSVMAVDVETKPTFDHRTPKILFQSKNIGFVYSAGTPWDIHPDGKRFLMLKTTAATDAEIANQQPKINIVLNWDEELKQRVPVD